MYEIIQSLEANVTNGSENFCQISERKLNAIKELSKREKQENQELKDKIKGLVNYAYGAGMSVGEFKEFYKLATGKEYNPKAFNKGVE